MSWEFVGRPSPRTPHGRAYRHYTKYCDVRYYAATCLFNIEFGFIIFLLLAMFEPFRFAIPAVPLQRHFWDTRCAGLRAIMSRRFEEDTLYQRHGVSAYLASTRRAISSVPLAGIRFRQEELYARRPPRIFPHAMPQLAVVMSAAMRELPWRYIGATPRALRCRWRTRAIRLPCCSRLADGHCGVAMPPPPVDVAEAAMSR